MGSLYEIGPIFRPNFRVLGRWMRTKLLKKHNMWVWLLKKYLLVLRRLEELNFSGLRRTLCSTMRGKQGKIEFRTVPR